MASGLALLARRAGNARQALARRGGGGGPLTKAEPPRRPLAEQDEMVWQDGTGRPEFALDQFTLVSSSDALRWLLSGMSIFAVVGTYMKFSAPEERKPYAPKAVLVPAEIEATFARN